MRKAIFVTVTFLIFCLSYILCGCSQKVPQASILAEFKDQVVTVDEFEKEISELPEWKQKNYKDQEKRAEYLTLMAESRMLLQTANEQKLNKDPEIVKQMKEYEDQLLVKELVKREVDDQVKVTDNDVKVYYDQHLADYVEPEKLQVTEITMKDEEKAKEVLAKIKAGADFDQLAKEMDESGESAGPGQGNAGKARPFSRDSYSSAREFVEASFKLKIGEVSDIVVQPLGEQNYYMIIRADELIPSRQKEFSEVEKNVRKTVEKDVKKKRMDEWLGELKAKKDFQLYPDRIPQIAVETEEKAAEEATTTEEAATSGEEKPSEETKKAEAEKSDQ